MVLFWRESAPSPLRPSPYTHSLALSISLCLSPSLSLSLSLITFLCLLPFLILRSCLSGYFLPFLPKRQTQLLKLSLMGLNSVELMVFGGSTVNRKMLFFELCLKTEILGFWAEIFMPKRCSLVLPYIRTSRPVVLT